MDSKNQEADLVNKMLSMDLDLILDGTNIANVDLNARESYARTSFEDKRSAKVEMVSRWLEQAKHNQQEGQLGLEGLRRIEQNGDLHRMDQNGAKGLEKLTLEGLRRMDQNGAEGLDQKLALEGLRRIEQNVAEGLDEQLTLNGLRRIQQNGRLEDQMRLDGHLPSENWISGSFPSRAPATTVPAAFGPLDRIPTFRPRNRIPTQEMVDYNQRLPYQTQQTNLAPHMSASLPEHCGINVYVHQTRKISPLQSVNTEGLPTHVGSLPIHEESNPIHTEKNPIYNSRLSSRVNYTPGTDSIYNWTTLGSEFHPRSSSLGSGFQPFSTPMGRTRTIMEEQRPRSNTAMGQTRPILEERPRCSSLGGPMRPALVGQPGGPRVNPRRNNGQRVGAGKSVCNFCKTNGERSEVYQSHNTGPPGSVTCPNLFKHQCEICGATGKNAHTRGYCPQRESNDRPLVLALKSTQRRSDGRLRKESASW